MADLIDRQELLKHKGNCYDEEGHLLYAVGTGTILLMPTVDAEPVRHGHWIERTKVYPALFTDSTYIYECSNCGYMDTHGANVEVPYCWHCGARMDVETGNTYSIGKIELPKGVFQQIYDEERKEDE